VKSKRLYKFFYLATNFGVVLAATDNGGMSGAPEVDHIMITVFYSEASGASFSHILNSSFF